MPKKCSFIDGFLKWFKKYSSVFNFFGYVIAIATLIISAHSAISSKKSLDLAISQYQESLLPTWSWTINDSASILTIHSTDPLVEVEEVCACFPTQITGEEREWLSLPNDNSLHLVAFKGYLELFFEQLYNKLKINEDDIICSSIAIPTYMQISYIQKGQRRIIKQLFLLRCDLLYDVERPIQIMFSKLYFERFLKFDDNGQEATDKSYENLIKKYKTTLRNKYGFKQS